MHPRARSALLVAGTLAAAAAAIVTTLMIPPIVGIADNGDFDRVATPSGLRSVSDRPEDRFYRWMQPRFAYAPRAADPSAFRSSEFLLVEAAVGAAKLFSRAPHFDIRFLGAVHAALLLAALAMLVRAAAPLSVAAQAVTAVLLVFFFTDPAYLAPFQSFYAQTASLLFLLLTAAIVALAVGRGGLSGAWIPAYFLAAALFVCSKPQESVQTVLLAPLGVRLAWPGSRRARAGAAVLAVLLGALAWRYYRSAQASAGWATRYNVLFMGILLESPDPRRDLEELGLDPSLARYAGVSAWVPESPARFPEVREFLEPRSGKPSPRILYLRHPKRLVARLVQAARSSYLLQPPDLGNFARESGAPPKARVHAVWSDLRVRLSGVTWPVTLFAGTLAAAALTWKRAGPRGRLAREALAVLVAMAAGAFVVAALGDFELETGRHLYAFHAMCDLILTAGVVWIVQIARVRAR
jgi:hypothetical protein